MQGCAGEEVVYVGETVGSLEVDPGYKWDAFGATFRGYVPLVKERSNSFRESLNARCITDNSISMNSVSSSITVLRSFLGLGIRVGNHLTRANRYFFSSLSHLINSFLPTITIAAGLCTSLTRLKQVISYPSRLFPLANQIFCC